MQIIDVSPYSHNYATSKRFSIDLRLSENPLGPSPSVFKEIVNSTKNLHLYPHNENELIKLISQYHHVPEESIFIGAGANQLLEQYLKVFAVGKNIVVPSATFPESIACMSALKGSVSKIPLNQDFSLNIQAMYASCNLETAFIHLCNPNNPTGIWTDTHLLSSIFKNSPVPLLISEAGADFVGQSMISSSFKDNVIVIRSFSKAYGLAGLRIGYSIASPEIIHRMKGYTRPYQVSCLSIAAAIAAIQDQDHLKKSIHYIFNEKAWLMNEMKLLGFDVVPSHGQNFIARIPEKFSSATDFCELANKNDIAVVNCSIYPDLEKYIRISPQLHEVNDQFIHGLKKLIIEKIA